jgi:hypothetical protein
MPSPATPRVSLLRCILATPVVIVPSIEVGTGGALGAILRSAATAKIQRGDAGRSGDAAGRRTISR